MTNKGKLIYLAGIIDGEGHFYTPNTVNGRKEKHIYPRLVIVNTNKELIDWIKDNFNGSVHCYKSTNSKRKDCYRWTLTGSQVTILAKQLLPYLIVKRYQVSIVL